MVYLTRKLHFCAAHRLFDPNLSDDDNRDRFGECMNLHGHNYQLEVTLVGEPDPRHGMVIHLSRLDEVVKERVVNRLDHKYLNEDVPVFRDVVPTLEMLAKYAWDQLGDDVIAGASLHRIRISEDNRFFADYFGE